MNITIETLLKHQAALQKKFGHDTIVYHNVRTTQLSVARYWGQCGINGKTFLYIPEQDLLVRDDVVKYIAKLEKDATKPKRKGAK